MVAVSVEVSGEIDGEYEWDDEGPVIASELSDIDAVGMVDLSVDVPGEIDRDSDVGGIG